MGVVNSIVEAIKSALRFIRNVIRKVIDGILNFAKHVVGWFRSLGLDPSKHTPFAGKVEEMQQIKELIRNAPVKNVGIFEGVYNEDTDEIEHFQVIDATDVDEKTRQVIGKEPLVVLS